MVGNWTGGGGDIDEGGQGGCEQGVATGESMEMNVGIEGGVQDAARVSTWVTRRWLESMSWKLGR